MKDREFQSFLRVLATASFTFLLAILIIRQIYVAFDSQSLAGTRWIKERYGQAVSWIETHPASDQRARILFLGSSEIEVGFDPNSFDREMEKRGIRSYSLNLGVRDADSRMIHLATRRLSESLSKKPKLALTVIAFSPARLTRRYLKAATEGRQYRYYNDVRMVLSTSQMLQEAFRKDPVPVLESLVLEKALGNVSPSTFTTLAWVAASEEFYRRSPPQLPWDIYLSNTFELWSAIKFNPSPAWDGVRQGRFYFNYERQAAELERVSKNLTSPSSVNARALFYQNSDDGLGAHLDSLLLDEFTESINEAKKFSDRVVIITTPTLFDPRRAPEARERIQEGLKSVAARTGVKVLDYELSSLGFDLNDYLDPLHLNLSGRMKFASVLARDLAPMIQRRNP